MDLGLEDRVYVVGGGSRGIGYATAAALVAEKACVVLAARRRDVVEQAARELGPERAEGLAVDLADPDAAHRLVDVARSRFGRLDGALCNVGGPAPGQPSQTDDAAWELAFRNAFLAPVRLARVAAGAVGEGGALLFVLSSSARSPIPGLAASNALRPGLAMHVKDLADELGPRGVRVNAVLPGRIATDRTTALDAAAPDPAAARAERESSIPLRRYGDPAEIGRVAAFLLSPAASYVTGASVAVDGGLLRAV